MAVFLFIHDSYLDFEPNKESFMTNLSKSKVALHTVTLRGFNGVDSKTDNLII